MLLEPSRNTGAIHIDESPAEFAGDFRTKPVHFIIVTLDADDVRAVDQGVDDLALLQIRRNKHVGLQTGGSGVGATEFARLPVEAQATVSKPSSRARLSATLTTRSLNESEG